MPSSCCVVGCTVKGGKESGLGMFRFPQKKPAIFEQWISNISRADWYPNENSRVCSRHFVDGRPIANNPCPILELGYERQAAATECDVGARSPSKSVQRALSATSPSRRQRRILRNYEETREKHASGSVVGKELTPKRRYHDPTNPETPGTERRKRILEIEKEESNLKRKRKRRELDQPVFHESKADSSIVAHSYASEPSSVMESSFSPPLEALVLEPEPCGLDETFTDSADSQEKFPLITPISVTGEKDRPSSARSIRRVNRNVSERRRVSLSALDETRKTTLLIKYKNKYRREKKLCDEAKRTRYFGWHRIEHNDKETSKWTGFPSFEVLSRVFHEYIENDAEKLSIKPGGMARRKRKRPLNVRNEFLLTLVRLRVNIPSSLLASLFGIKRQYADLVLTTWIPYLAAKFRVFIDWVPRSEGKRLPHAFKLFPKCVGVVDCFELQLQKPSNRALRQKLWSEYKQRYTAKFLVVTSPNGLIMYISPAWGGRTSDQHVVINSSEFLNNLNPGDEILGDRGFDMRSFFLLEHRVHLRIPHFLKKDTQFTRSQVDVSRKLATARVHVERCIGRLRQFRILSQTYPVKLFPLIDDVAVICSAVVNMHPPIVK